MSQDINTFTKADIAELLTALKSEKPHVYSAAGVIEMVKTLGFPLVMCGFMAYAFWDTGGKLFSEFIEAGRKNSATNERIANRVDEQAVQHKEDMKAINAAMQKQSLTMEKQSVTLDKIAEKVK